MTTIARLTSTKLVVDDLESTKTFYCEAYGFSERGRSIAPVRWAIASGSSTRMASRST